MVKHRIRRACVASGLLLGAFALSGCGSSNSSRPALTPDPTDPNTPVVTTFEGTPVPAQGPVANLGRSFVTLTNGKATEVGFQLTDEGIRDQPPTAITDDAPNIYQIPLPAEVAATTPFRAMLVFYFTGHPKDPVFRPLGEPEHFHCVFLLNPPGPADPPQFTNEFTIPAADEVPVGAPAGVPPTIVPGLGQSYDDPTKPVGQPPRVTVGNNFLIYKGHLNGIAVGDDVSFLQSLQTETDSVLQPQVYPKAGVYPTTWTVRYDPVKKVHVFALSGFKEATKHL